MGDALMRLADLFYTRVMRPVFFTLSADRAHAITTHLLSRLDAFPHFAKWLSPSPVSTDPVTVGGVGLPTPVMVAAGLVKGHGFADQARAVQAVKNVNIIPGWRSVPLMCGAVEFGSYTRYPRLGNSGQVMWRDPATKSTQNRVGLRNPGALAAAEFLSVRKIPGVFGISIATTPGQSSPELQADHVSQSMRLFLERGVRPSWFTINLSCPNTEDDPQAGQTGELADAVCKAAVASAAGTPVWTKIGPDLSETQHEVLIKAFNEAGIRAVVATNTLAAPIADSELTAGIAGGQLFEMALSTVARLSALRDQHGYTFDIVGCGGVMDGNNVRAYTDAGAKAVQIWSVLVYRGPFAAAHIAREFAAVTEAN